MIDLEVLFDTISEEFYRNKASIIMAYYIVSQHHKKVIDKAQSQVFGEVNWPTHRLLNDDQKFLSGYFMAISGANVKTFILGDCIAKVFSTSKNRFCYMAYSDNAKFKAIAKTDTKLQMALRMAGLESSHILNKVNVDNDEYSRANEIFVADNVVSKSSTNNSNGISYNEISDGENLSFLVLDIKHIIKGEFEDFELYKLMDSIEKLLSEKTVKWCNLILGMAESSNIECMQKFKAVCKERKIPLSPLFFSDNIIHMASQNSFNLQFSFAIGYEGEA